MFDFIVEHIRVAKNTECVLAEHQLQENLGFTSLNLITLIISICDEFDIDVADIPEADIASAVTVGDLCLVFSNLCVPQ